MRGARRAAAELTLLTDRAIVVVEKKIRLVAAHDSLKPDNGQCRAMAACMLAAWLIKPARESMRYHRRIDPSA
jgi:hypothetical protein